MIGVHSLAEIAQNHLQHYLDALVSQDGMGMGFPPGQGRGEGEGDDR